MARRPQHGFTLMELMITIGIIGVLAMIALPSFAHTSRRAQGNSEVNAFFGELILREEAYQLELGRYVSTSASETATFPAAPSLAARPLGPLPAIWTALKVRPPFTKARCTYAVIAGTPTDAAGPIATAQFRFTVPEKNWFYILARCDLDSDPATNSLYFASSENNVVQVVNRGR